MQLSRTPLYRTTIFSRNSQLQQSMKSTVSQPTRKQTKTTQRLLQKLAEAPVLHLRVLLIAANANRKCSSIEHHCTVLRCSSIFLEEWPAARVYEQNCVSVIKETDEEDSTAPADKHVFYILRVLLDAETKMQLCRSPLYSNYGFKNLSQLPARGTAFGWYSHRHFTLKREFSAVPTKLKSSR